MLTFYRKSLTQRNLTSETDVVTLMAPIPSESSLDRVWADIHLLGTTEITIDRVGMYGAAGIVSMNPDPGGGDNADSLWDKVVGKMVDISLVAASDIVDIDYLTADFQPFWEPGEANVNQLLQIGEIEDKDQWFGRRKLMSYVTIPRAYEVATDLFRVGDQFKIKSRKKVRAERESYAMLGFASPKFDDVETSLSGEGLDGPDSIKLWTLTKYLEMAIEQAWMQVTGMTETGAESPWDFAADWIEELLTPTVTEVTTSSFANLNYNIWSDGTFQVTVPGRREFNQVSMGGLI